MLGQGVRTQAARFLSAIGGDSLARTSDHKSLGLPTMARDSLQTSRRSPETLHSERVAFMLGQLKMEEDFLAKTALQRKRLTFAKTELGQAGLNPSQQRLAALSDRVAHAVVNRKAFLKKHGIDVSDTTVITSRNGSRDAAASWNERLTQAVGEMDEHTRDLTHQTVRRLNMRMLRAVSEFPLKYEEATWQDILNELLQMKASVPKSDQQPWQRSAAIFDRLTHNGPDNLRSTLLKAPQDRFAAAAGNGFVLLGIDAARFLPTDELAGVLAHEVKHNYHRDWMNGFNIQTLNRTLKERWSKRMGDADNTAVFEQELSGAIEKLEKKFNHMVEYKADAAGARLAADRGFDAWGLHSFLMRQKEVGDSHTHPAEAQRLRALKHLIRVEKLSPYQVPPQVQS